MIPEPGVVPVALAEPTVRVRGRWTAAVVLANVGVFAAWLGPIQVLLAKQSEAVAAGNKEFVFGLVTGAGAAVSVVANPLFGAISDRTTSRFGRRVPWVLALSVLPYLLRSGDERLVQRSPLVVPDFLRGFWISPSRFPDFGWGWLTRFLFNVGNALGTLYLFYYLQDEVGVDDADTAVLILTAIYSVCVLITAVAFGKWSDRVARRKIFVTGSGVVMAVAGVVLAFWPTWPGAVLGAVILGAGFGVYLSVDFALLTEVLPSARDRAKDLGVINIANSLPQVIAPALAAPIVKHLGGYPVLYLLASAVTVLGAVLVRQIRSVA